MANTKQRGLSDNAIGALAYFTPIPAIFFLAIRRYNKRPYVRFHAWQSLVFDAFVFIFCYVLSFVLPLITHFGPRLFRDVGWLVALIAVACLLVWIWCVVGALNGKLCKLPVIGDWADEQAYR
ncbi:MAG TPA: Tic20 family protein [Terracidiphilus sp.]|nr:Tic20 family protein [Terracidiphilus sp.]HUX28616.1 Tic20 family protein [Terracidiphilus sp.]